MPLSDLCAKPKCLNPYKMTGMIAGGITFAVCSGMTFFTAHRVSSRLESSLDTFITKLFSQTLTIPVPDINVPVPVLDLAANVSTDFLVNIFNNFLNQSGIQLSNEQLQSLNQTIMINIKTPPNITLPVKVDDVSFSLLTLVGSSLDTIDNGVAKMADSVYVALIVIGFLFSVLIANAVLDKFFNYTTRHRAAKDEESPTPLELSVRAG